MSNRREQFEYAAFQFMRQQAREEEVIGVIVAGSYVYGRLDPHSDIDIFVILHPDCDYRERGNTWIDGVEVEYFKNPVQQVRAYFRKELSPHTADMFARGKLLYASTSLVTELCQEAREIIAKGPAEIKEVEVELGKYFLDDLHKDLMDCQASGEGMALDLIRMKLIDRCIDLFCKSHRIWRPKDKRLAVELDKVDAEFVGLLRATTQPDWQASGAIPALVDKMAALLGGKRPKEWRFRGALDL